jgi:hypothetical protein
MMLNTSFAGLPLVLCNKLITPRFCQQYIVVGVAVTEDFMLEAALSRVAARRTGHTRSRALSQYSLIEQARCQGQDNVGDNSYTSAKMLSLLQHRRPSKPLLLHNLLLTGNIAVAAAQKD